MSTEVYTIVDDAQSSQVRQALSDLVAAVSNMRVPQNAAEAALQVTVTVGPALDRARAALAAQPQGVSVSADTDKLLEEAVREREDYNGKHQIAVIEIERLRQLVAVMSRVKSIGVHAKHDAKDTYLVTLKFEGCQPTIQEFEALKEAALSLTRPKNK